MKIARPPHNWAITARQAVALQQKLARSVRAQWSGGRIRLVAGLDAAFVPAREHCIGGVVLWDLAEKVTVEEHTAVGHYHCPYIPGLLSFREGPALIAALRKLQHRPDLVICDGQGIAHPRRLGLASHLGLLIGIPTVGCAKSRLIGTYRKPGPQKGARTLLRDKDEVVGAVLRTRAQVKPVFVSVGHNIDLPTAVRVVLACVMACRLPEPTRLADHLVAAAARKGRGRRCSAEKRGPRRNKGQEGLSHGQ